MFREPPSYSLFPYTTLFRSTLFLQRTAPALAVAGARQPMVLAGLVLVLAAPAFKLASVPFHAWAPDTYLGAPLPVAAYLSVVRSEEHTSELQSRENLVCRLL